MVVRGNLVRVLAVVFLLGVVGVGAAFADTITQTFEHSLAVGTHAQSWEHRIDLPDAWAMKGQFFVKRSLALTGKMVIEREELKPNYYYVKVRLPKAYLWVAKGNLQVTLEGGAEAPATPVLEPCTGLKVSGYGTTPKMAWIGQGKFTALTLLDRTSGESVWERVILGKTTADLDEGNLSVGHHYFFGARQSDETGRYSAETRAGFRVDVKKEKCRYCYGSGWETCRNCNGAGHIVSTGPNGQPVYTICGACNGTGRQRCTWCNGTGYTEVPIIVNE